MAPELQTGRRSVSPESSGRDSPAPRQWRNQLSAADEPHARDKAFRKYALGVERALALFETALQEWADYISFLNRLLKALQARQPTMTQIPSKTVVAKRLSQCLNPSLPSGVHQKALEVYNYIFSVIGPDGLSRDLPLYLPGLAPTLSFASLSARAHFLDLLERHFLDLDPRALRPALKSLILGLLPGLEDETAEDFDRTLKLVNRFKTSVRPASSKDLTDDHATGDDFFWQCFFLATITSQSRRPGALAYLARFLPKLGQVQADAGKNKKNKTPNSTDATLQGQLSELITSPEPGLLLRCFTAGLGDEQLLIQRGFLDLLVAHLPLHASVLQSRVKPSDLELLMRAACGVVIRREMSLNRRLTAWLLGPLPQPGNDGTDGTDGTDGDHPESPTALADTQPAFAPKTSYFEEHGLQPLTRALLSMVQDSPSTVPAERARPYRICLSLMDRWEIGGLVVPEVFLPIVDSVRKYKAEAASKADFYEVLRSASVFFDGVESGLIYGEMLGLVAQAVGATDLTPEQRADKLGLVEFILQHFNVREEEMVTVHAPLTALSILCMLESATATTTQALTIAVDLLDIVPERAFPATSEHAAATADVLQSIRDFYVNDQGSLETDAPPYSAGATAELLLRKACALAHQALATDAAEADLPLKTRVLLLLLEKTPSSIPLDVAPLLAALHDRLARGDAGDTLAFTTFSSVLHVAIHLHLSERISTAQLAALVPSLVARAWRFLAATEPKYHVETVRSLWLLQTALGTARRDIEAAVARLMTQHDVRGAFATRHADPGRSFAVLWLHTLQDSPTAADRRTTDRRTPKMPTPGTPSNSLRSVVRLAGVDYYDVMLTRPLFLVLDALLDERTQLFMAAKTWLASMVGLDRLCLVLAKKFLGLGVLRRDWFAPKTPRLAAGTGSGSDYAFDDDVDLCLYYLRTVHNVFRWAPATLWSVLGRRTIKDSLLRDTGSDEFVRGEQEMTYQELFVHVCMKCVVVSKSDTTRLCDRRDAQLSRYALLTLHHILQAPDAASLAYMHLEDPLLERLGASLAGPDPYIQTLLLDVLASALKLREAAIVAERPASPVATEKRTFSSDLKTAAATSATSTTTTTTTASASTEEVTPPTRPPPPAPLLKCIQAGFGAPSSRAVLDSWVSFLALVLPMYADSIFQVLIPLVETLCTQIGSTFAALETIFGQCNATEARGCVTDAPEATLISLLNALEQVVATAHQMLVVEEARHQAVKSPDTPQGFFGTIFASDAAPQTRSATANDRLTVLLAFQDAVRISFRIWTWGKAGSAAAVGVQDATSAASFNYTSLRMRNRARRLLEQLFRAEMLECLETTVALWRAEDLNGSENVFDLLLSLDATRPKNTVPALFNAIYSRTNPGALHPARTSTLTVSLADTDIVVFLVDYARSLEADVMDEIWGDCTFFLKDLLGNPFPHRQSLACLLEFAAILGEKVDNTNFGEQRKMRRELGDLFLRLLTALFTTRPLTFDDAPATSTKTTSRRTPAERADDIVGVLAAIVPDLPKILMDTDRVLAAAATISTSVVGPALRAKAFPETMSASTLRLLRALSQLPNNQRAWKRDVADAFNDARFFGTPLGVVQSDWLALLRQWAHSDKERMPELLGRLTAPTTAGIVFGVGATSARLEADRRTQLTLRRVALLIVASEEDAFVADLPLITERVVELLGASATSSPSSTTRAEVYMVLRALVLKTSPVHLAGLWPLVDAELHAAVASVTAPDGTLAAETYACAALLQACKLLDVLVCTAPDDFQLRAWLFVTDTIDAVYRPASYQPVALADELTEALGAGVFADAGGSEAVTALLTGRTKRPLLGNALGDDVGLERRDELVRRVVRPFLSQLSIYAFESTYTMAPVDVDGCVQALLKDLFDERAIVKAL